MLNAVHYMQCTGMSPGLALTCADSGCQHLDVLGPPGLSSFWTSTAAFTHRKQHQVDVHEIHSLQSFDTGEVVVHAVPLLSSSWSPPSASPSSSSSTSSTTSEEKQEEGQKEDASPSSPTHVCYVCQTKSLPGRFDIQKAKALGVPVGPLYAALKTGADVTLDDGTVVHSCDVMGASEPPRFVAVICDVTPPSAAASDGSQRACDARLQLLVSDPYWTRCVSCP
jgi:ribonuclease BN (tRNA processing enzyme)